MKLNQTLLPVVGSLVLAGSANAQLAWLNEFHYDNVSTDAGEFVEVVVAPSFGGLLSDIAVTLYNGSGGAAYDTETLDSFTLGSTVNGYRILSKPISPIQNGDPDGIAISISGSLVQFLSYEGTFTATGGPANGVLSTDVGVAQGNSTPTGSSLGLIGTGAGYSSFAWSSFSAASAGSVNAGQTLVPEPHEYAMLAGLGLVGFALWRRRAAK